MPAAAAASEAITDILGIPPRTAAGKVASSAYARSSAADNSVPEGRVGAALPNYTNFYIACLSYDPDPVEFPGPSLDDLRELPLEAPRKAGLQFDRVQRGLDPDGWTPMTSTLDLAFARYREFPKEID